MVVKKGVTFYECELEEPQLEIAEKIYMTELDKIYTIVDKVRSINGEIIYYVSEPLEVIEDEKTEESLKKAKQKMEDFNIKHKAQEKEQEKEQGREKFFKGKKWYKFWRE